MTKVVKSLTIPTALAFGRAVIEQVEGVEIIEDFEFDSDFENWILHLKLRPADLAFNDFVPSETEWFVTVEKQYPFGRIDFFPSQNNGIVKTFPHQKLNLETPTGKWRQGSICLSEPYAVFEDSFFVSEPYTAEERLLWHIKRALSWLEYASQNKLLAKGDYFEMPVFESPFGKETLITFAETDVSLEVWKEKQRKVGFFEYHISNSNSQLLLIKNFLNLGKKPFLAPNWGDYIQSFQTSKNLGVWIKLESLPVVPPWQAPLNWGELKLCLKKQGIALDEYIDLLFSTRSKKEHINSIALIGFPIPDKIGEEFDRYHWQGLNLPTLNFRDSKINGFQPSAKNASYANRSLLNSSTSLDWFKSENWYPDQIRSRGSLPTEILEKRTLLIGAGAVGSAIAEMLVRGGFDRLTICDDDLTKAGNLVRHTLDYRHISQNKSQALCSHLNQISPYAKIKHLDKKFPPKAFNLSDYDLIIDCSGSQATLSALAAFESSESIEFISLSMSFGAKRLYFFYSQAKKFSFEQYKKNICYWLEKDFEENKNVVAPREGIGCWHPVFPARSDDVWLMASTGYKLMIKALENKINHYEFKVFEQNDDDDFQGIKEVKPQ